MLRKNSDPDISCKYTRIQDAGGCVCAPSAQFLKTHDTVTSDADLRFFVGVTIGGHYRGMTRFINSRHDIP